MKGYWINHILEVKDAERFTAYAEAAHPLLDGDNKYGAKMLMRSTVRKTLKGSPVQAAAVVEFDSVQAAIDFWDDTDYAKTRLLMGPLDDETAVVDRRVCCIEAETLTAEAGQGFWINHVHEIVDETVFFSYADASMEHFTSAIYGPVVHQHAGGQKIQLAAALGLENLQAALETYDSASYQAGLEIFGMATDERTVVNRTICAIEA